MRFPDEFAALGHAGALEAIDALGHPGGVAIVQRRIDVMRKARGKEIRTVIDAIKREARLTETAGDPTLSDAARMRARLEASNHRFLLRTFLVDALDERAWTPPTHEQRVRLSAGDDAGLQPGDSPCIRSGRSYLAGADRQTFDLLRSALRDGELGPNNGDDGRRVWVCVGHERPDAAGCGIVFRGQSALFCPDCRHPLDYSLPETMDSWSWKRPFDPESRERIFHRRCEVCGEAISGKSNRTTCSQRCRTAKARAAQAP